MTIVEGMKNVASHVSVLLWKFSLDISRRLFLKVEEISAAAFKKLVAP